MNTLAGLSSSDLALVLALPVALVGTRYGALLGAAAGLGAGALQAGAWLRLSQGGLPLAPALAAGVLALIGGLSGELAARERARRLASARAVWTNLRSAQLSEFLSYALYQLREYQISVTSLVEALALAATKNDGSIQDRLERLRRVVAELNGKTARLLGEDSVPTARRSRAGEFEVGEIARQAAEEAAQAFAGGAPAPVSVQCPDGRVKATGDMMALRLALLAVLQNSLEACSSRGQGAITITVRKGAQSATLEIVDDAGGPLGDAAMLFEPFFSARAGSPGLGLGLSMARRMLERAGATMAAKPRPGSMVVEIEFPLTRDLPFLRNDETTWARRRQAI